jgi:hypothetical protein
MDEVEYLTDGQVNTLRMRAYMAPANHQPRKSAIRGSCT